jgi:Na+-transporting NADH:ubiquinone oxidoreductase subunit A
MEAIRIKGGHRFRIKHGPAAERSELDSSGTVGLSPRGLAGLKPKVLIKEGDTVKRGQVLFHDKKRPDVKFTSPAGGTVKEVRYGSRRVLQAVVIDVDEANEEAEDFGATDRGGLGALGSDAVVEKLTQSGLWSRMIAFPGWQVAPIPGEPPPPVGEHDEPHPMPTIRALYVSAVGTEPHEPDPAVALKGHEDLFAAGLEVVKQIAKKTWLFSPAGNKLPSEAVSVTGVQHRVIEDRYPSGNVGLQVHYTEHLDKDEVAVGLTLEDVIDIGHLFLNGNLRTHRTYSRAGNAAEDRKHYLARQGETVGALAGVDADDSEVRLVAGGLFTGTKVAVSDFVSPWERGVQVLGEDRRRTKFHFFPWRLGANLLTLNKAWIAGYTNPEVEATTSNNGEHRACVQCSQCIDYCPVGLMPNIVFKAALEEDIEKMEARFIHDCVDCGLCTFVCPSKIELAQIIEDGKAMIAKEG